MRGIAPALALITLPLAAETAPAGDFWRPSAELNHVLPGWLRFSGELRGRLEGYHGLGFRQAADGGFGLYRVRLGLVVQPLSWWSVTLEAQDARAWGRDERPPLPQFQDTLDLRLAFTQLGNPEKDGFSLKAGRMGMNYGEQRLLGTANWGNSSRAYDAVVGMWRRGQWRLDAFAASVVDPRPGFNRRRDGNNLHGLWGGVETRGGQVEPFLLWRVAPDRDTKTFGARWAGRLPGERVDYAVEMVRQTGRFRGEPVSAWAGHWLAGYTMTERRFRPHWIGEYNHATGDRAPGDGRSQLFDQLYPTPHDKYGLGDQVGWRNIHHLRGGVELGLTRAVSLRPNVHAWWLASARDGLYTAQGVLLAAAPDGSAGRRVGSEIDVQVLYTASRNVLVGCGATHLFPGPFLRRTTTGAAYTWGYVMVTYFF